MGNAILTRRGGGSVKVNYTLAKREMVIEALPELSQLQINAAVARNGNGRIVIGGGHYNSAYYNIVAWYDSEGGSGYYANMPTPRSDCAAVRLGCGNVIFAGGYSGGAFLSTVDMYSMDGVRSSLAAMTSGGGLGCQGAADGNGCAVLANGKITVNSNGYGTTVHKYSANGAVRTTLASRGACQYPAAAATGDGGVIFAAGDTGGAASIADVDKYSIDGVKTSMPPLFPASGYYVKMRGALDGSGKTWFINSQGHANIYDKSGKHTTMSGMTVYSGTAESLMPQVISDGENIWTFQNNANTLMRITPDGVKTSYVSNYRVYPAMETDEVGNIYLIGGVANLTADLHTSPDAKITATVGAYYKFEEHGAEQQTTTGMITVKTPNKGYVRIKKGNAYI